MRRLLPLLLCAAPLWVWPVQAAEKSLNVQWQPISGFDRKDRRRTDFGALTFLRGGTLSASDRVFGSWSGLRLENGGSEVIAISDKGAWLRATFDRNAEGDITGVSNALTAPILNEDGDTERAKFNKDAEALALAGDRAFVSFERLDLVRQYDWPVAGLPSEGTEVPFRFPKYELRQNEGLEALAIAPAASVLGRDTKIAISEGSINPAGDLFAFVMDGPQKGTFFVKRSDRYNVTDADFLPNGDLVLLERRLTYRDGLSMRLRLIDDAAIVPSRTVDGQILMEANLAQVIDNMEGLSIWQQQNQDGTSDTIFSIISDDNNNFLQSTVYLEFRYDGQMPVTTN
jgi:hypothetical protein